MIVSISSSFVTAVVERSLQMERKLVRPVSGDERRDRDETQIARKAVARGARAGLERHRPSGGSRRLRRVAEGSDANGR